MSLGRRVEDNIPYFIWAVVVLAFAVRLVAAYHIGR